MKWKTNKGFTLIELLLVLAIIAIIASALWVSLGSSRIKARNGRIQTNIANIKRIIEANYNVSGGFSDLRACVLGDYSCGRNPNADIDTLEEDIRKLQDSATVQIRYFTTPYIDGASVSGYSIYAYFINENGGATSESNNGGYICYDSKGNNKIVATTNSTMPDLPANNDTCE